LFHAASAGIWCRSGVSTICTGACGPADRGSNRFSVLFPSFCKSRLIGCPLTDATVVVAVVASVVGLESL